ncbi:patatin-like phospholipase domain-containing protein 2 isoform X2 [Etheostoma spectabile]|uniref:patatin-like phospholipase domain-containing protein 2 isoform X2 n=1 Tax=Etheostoma spectabile TaxID=54343 RepID=UPI0013AFE8F0|nr:patatin-like phospholipase domain-containing protein 2 isoform X2 [Etheostoma spectabile]
MSPGVSSCHYREIPPSISFSGSGFMAIYQLGVSQCLLNYAPWILRTAPCVLGASAGSLVAAAVVCEMSLSTIRDEMLNFAKQMKGFTFGPLNPSINVFHWLECILHKHVPSNAHQVANGRLFVSMTRLSDGKHIVMSEFQSKEDVIKALLCSCFVPVYCGMLPPSFNGVYYLDGGFSSMQPEVSLPCMQTLTVSPFSGEIDICPVDKPCMWDMVVSGTTLKVNMANSFRIINALYPMNLEILEQSYHNGYKDAVHFLLRNDLAPYLTIHKVSQGPHNFHQTKTWINVETAIEEEKEMRVEKEAITLTSFITNRRMQTGSSTEHELTGNRQILLINMVTYLSMFGLPVRILSHLLVPFILLFYALLQSRHGLELLLRKAFELVFWVWHCQRHFAFFFFNICVCTVKKNTFDRVMPIILLLQWLIRTPNEAPQGRRPATPSSAH